LHLKAGDIIMLSVQFQSDPAGFTGRKKSEEKSEEKLVALRLQVVRVFHATLRSTWKGGFPAPVSSPRFKGSAR
jgi:hypothetical protein